jgi:hypothetical protein
MLVSSSASYIVENTVVDDRLRSHSEGPPVWTGTLRRQGSRRQGRRRTEPR